MKSNTHCTPDALPPGIRSIGYGVFCWLNRNILVLRALGAVLRLWPFVGGWVGVVARVDAVKRVLLRTRSFSNTSHVPNLVAGDYLIAMDPGPTYDGDRKLFDQRLAILEASQKADEEAQRRIGELRKGLNGSGSFDLIECYLMWVVYRGIEEVFGTAAKSISLGDQAGAGATDEGLEKQFLMETRYVAGQLLAGGSSTLDVQRRAEVCADALRARIRAAIVDIRGAWSLSATMPQDMVERNAIGMAWISHPVTVQSAALVVQELLTRKKVYRQLWERADRLGEAVWSDEGFREDVRGHVLELMRFRPIFPLLARHVPRDTEFETGGRRNAPVAGGGKVTLLSIAAMFDPKATARSAAYCPHRQWQQGDDGLRYLMFGYGERQCPARFRAVEILTSALIGLLTLPELRLDGRKAVSYEGPLMAHMLMRRA